MEIDPAGFLRITLLPNSNAFDAAEAEKQIDAAHQLTKGTRKLVLVDSTQSTVTPTIEAKKILADVDLKVKEAIIVKSLGNRIIGNIFMKMVNRRYPTKMFTDEATALEWLLADKGE